MFYAPGFDPYLIVYQILCVQTLMYLDLGLWVCILTALTGTPLHAVSLRQLFSHNAVRLAFATGWIPFVAYIINAGVGALILCVVVERAKKCLDFTATFHLMHLFFCWQHGGFPSNWEWWAVNIGSLVGMAVLGEYLCMKRELQDIPLFGAQREEAESVNYSRVSRRQVERHASDIV